MAKENKKWWWYALGFLAFIIYIFIAARPIPKETILKPRWITSLELNYPVSLSDSVTDSGELLSFKLGERFGYIGDDGKFSINQVKKNYLSLAEYNWAEYEALPASVHVMNPLNENVLTIENPKGYPFFLDNRVFLIGNEQNSITAIGSGGEEIWTHCFPAPVTCIDAAGGYLLAGTLDGVVELLNSSGNSAFIPFEPGGSRLSVILGCAISSDTSHLALISGIDDQRFLLLERAGDSYKVIYHEFLTSGFRRPVHISFVEDDGKVAFEREGGLGIFDIPSRSSVYLPLTGEIETLENSGSGAYLFIITSQGPGEKRFIAVRYPGVIVMDAPFKSNNTFFKRRDRKLYLGGGLSIVSFELEKN